MDSTYAEVGLEVILWKNNPSEMILASDAVLLRESDRALVK